MAVTKAGGDNRERLCHREGRENVSGHLTTPEVFKGREEALGALLGGLLLLIHPQQTRLQAFVL